MTEIKNFAPVVIPTLNRYEHFKRCLESLERCTYSECTDVYIALDYPPSEKYVEGWKKIDAYLHGKEESNSFGSLNVVRREYNYGVGKAHSNSGELMKEIREKYDRWIFSEDDNEFSPDFLSYLNKGLELFYNDQRIYCICGYNRRIDVPSSFKANYYVAQDYIAWGIGQWKHKPRPEQYSSFEFLKQLLRDKQSYKKIKDRSFFYITGIMNMLKTNSLQGDMLVDLYETLEDKYSVLPIVSKVRNYGNDGTGVHTKKNVEDNNLYFTKQNIDTNEDFEFSSRECPLQPEGLKIYYPKSMTHPVKQFLWNARMRFDVFLVRYFGIVSHSRWY